MFKKTRNTLEFNDPDFKPKSPVIPEKLCIKCPGCSGIIFTEETGRLKICPKCGYHFRLPAKERIELICDEGSFNEHDADMLSRNILDFPGYDAKLNSARIGSRLKEAVITGRGKIKGFDAYVFAMDAGFMMGSMGSVVGEKITRLFERATEEKLPVVGFTLSGGARMQEGTVSLMQMAKVSGAVKRHSDNGNLYVAVLTHPTTGGVTASFAMQGDIILAEPKALIGFAGPRVIEQTTKQKLPEGFQRAEFLLKKGFIDDIVPRPRQKEYLAKLLLLHSKGAE